MHEGSRRAIIAALFANMGIAIAKGIAFLITGSSALLAEAIHSVADTGNQALLIFGGRRSQRRESPTHQFGYGSERYFWAFVVALVLFTLGAVFAIYEGLHKLSHPAELESPLIAVSVLVVAIGLESYSLRTAIREARPSKGRKTWWQFIRSTRNPELPVVLLEDVGALTGLFIALTGVSLSWSTGEPRFDSIASILIGLLLGVIAIVLAIEMHSLLLGEAADPETQQAVRDAMLAGSEVQSVIHMRTLHLGPEDLLVAAKIAFVPGDLPTIAAAIDSAEARIRAVVPTARLIYLEPDLLRKVGITEE
ncbi:MAG: cation diffusion facilitator family transporter [Actinomycetes bacterium]